MSGAARAGYGLLALAAAVAVGFLTRRVLCLPRANMDTLINEHPATVGIPTAAAFALLLIASVRLLDGPIRFDILGLKAEGAAAALVLYIAVFLAITLSIRALW